MDFWLTELRTPVLLIEAARLFQDRVLDLVPSRAAVAHACANSAEAIESALEDEERRAREADRRYWAPLREELERLRHDRR